MHFDLWTFFLALINLAVIGLIVLAVVLCIRYFKKTLRRIDKIEDKIAKIEQQGQQRH